MTQISAGYRSIDMTAWYFSSLKAGEFHGGADSYPGAIRITADNPDPYSHVSIFPEMLTVYIRLIGSGFGDFDAKGVPHSGVLDHAVMWTPWYDITVEFGSMNVPVQDFLAAVGSQSPTQLTALLNAGDDWISGFNGESSGPTGALVGDHLLGGPGNDTIQGHGGLDTIEGGAGDDWIWTVDGSTQTALIHQGARVDGGPGYDTVSYDQAPFGVVVNLSGAGTDTITNVEAARGSAFADTLTGSAAADVLFGGGGDDQLDGGAGDDFLQGDAGADSYLGGSGNDSIDADLGDRSLDAGPGDDSVQISRGPTTDPIRLTFVSLGDGDDHVYVRTVAGLTLTVDGGAGVNRAQLWPGDGAPVDVFMNQAHTGVGLVLNGFGDFSTQPGSAAFHLMGGDVAETVTGCGGADIIDGGGGNDLLTEDWAPAGTGAPETINGGSGDDTVSGAAGSNFLTGGDGSDNIRGGSGFDRTNGNAGNDTVSGGGGDDWVTGGKDNDVLYGDDGNDILNGNLGNDTEIGGLGNDTVRGGQGDDVLSGGDGNDWLTGDLGNDTMTGGAGADTFRAFNGEGVDVITDFNAGEGDRIQLDPGTTYSVSQVGADTIINLGAGSSLTLTGVTLSNLPSGWIFGA